MPEDCGGTDEGTDRNTLELEHRVVGEEVDEWPEVTGSDAGVETDDLLGAQLVSCHAPSSEETCSRNGRTRSTGTGKTIVELFDDPISSSVCK